VEAQQTQVEAMLQRHQPGAGSAKENAELRGQQKAELAGPEAELARAKQRQLQAEKDERVRRAGDAKAAAKAAKAAKAAAAAPGPDALIFDLKDSQAVVAGFGFR
jgi:hypothetical protein